MKISYSGFFLDQTGFGEASRRLLLAMNAAGLELSPGLTLADGTRQIFPDKMLTEFLGRARIDLPDVYVVHAAAMDFPQLMAPAKRRIGITCWETDRLHPLTLAGCRAVDEVWVPSIHNVKVFEQAGSPVRLIPYPVMEPSAEPEDRLGCSDSTFVFYTILTWQERKNPLGLLTAYLTGFTGQDDVELVIKVSGVSGWAKAKAESDLAVLLDALSLPDPPKVRILPGQWTQEEMWGLHARGDCFVLLTRGEAFGLPLLDALAAGSRIVTTAYGGALDFLTTAGAAQPGVDLVRTRMTPVVQRYPHFDGTQHWADPDLVHARELIRGAFIQGRTEKIRRDLPEFSAEAVGQRIRGALNGD